METREIPKAEWKDYFDQFSRLHKGTLTDVESMSIEAGLQRTGSKLPLMGTTVESNDSGQTTIELMLGDTPRAYLSHTITNPSHVRAAEWNDSYSAALQVECADGGAMLVRVGPQAELLAPGMVMDDILEPSSVNRHRHNTGRLNRAEWADCFHHILERYGGKPVSVQQLSGNVGLESIVQGLPLLDISVDQTREGEDPVVRIKTGSVQGGTVTELIAAPSRVMLSEWLGVETALHLQSETGQAIKVEFPRPTETSANAPGRKQL